MEHDNDTPSVVKLSDQQLKGSDALQRGKRGSKEKENERGEAGWLERKRQKEE